MPRLFSNNTGTAEVSAAPGSVIAPGQSVFGPFGAQGRLVNDTDSIITLDATDPPTAVSLQAQGLTVPVENVQPETMAFSF